MGALLSLPITLINFLLPFTRPGTPLIQDIIHTVILCGTLYYAPQIAEWYNSQANNPHAHFPGAAQGTEGDAHEHIEGNEAPVDQPVNGFHQDDIEQDIPLDDRLVLADDGDGAPGDAPPPLAPTPPPFGAQRPRAPPAPHVADEFEPMPGIDAGPANPRVDGPRNTPANRVVGAKKAKSLARKDERRRYHEWHRQEAHLRKLQEEEGREEREAALRAERERRAAVEEEIREREREERERVKREREQEMVDEAERRERVIKRVESAVREAGAVDMVDLASMEGMDRAWIEALVRASGLLARLQRDGIHAFLTETGWLVKIDQELMDAAYAEAARLGNLGNGRVGLDEFAQLLEKAVLARGSVTAY